MENSKVARPIGKFYRHDLEKSRSQSAKRFQEAQAQNKIPVLAENQLLHLIEIAENGLPDCYSSFDNFLSDFWPDFSWTPEKSILEIEAVLVDSRFKEIIPILKETWN